jgi:hypothetical protein
VKHAAAAVVLVLSVLATSACGGSGAVSAASHPTKVRLPFALGALSAQGSLVAAAPAGHNPQLGGAEQALHAVIWDEAKGGVDALKLPHICANPSGLALAGPGKAVVLCDDSCCGGSEQLVAALATAADPVPIMHAEIYSPRSGDRIDGLAGSGDLIAFNLERMNPHGGTKDARLYLVDGTHAHAIASGPNKVGTPVSVAGGRILTERQQVFSPKQTAMFGPPDVYMRVFNITGRVVSNWIGSSVPQDVPVPPAAFDGKRAYSVDFYEHWLLVTRPDGSNGGYLCFVGPGVTLGGVSGDYLTYTTADAVHVIRISTCHDAVLKAGGGVPVGSVITPAGVFYVFNSRSTIGMPSSALAHNASTLTFVPTAQLRKDVEHGTNLSQFGLRG